MRQGLLIALEGIDGAGTTTQLPRLAEHLRSQGHSVHTTAEPSTGPIGRLIRQALGGDPSLGEGTLALLFAADRLDHLRREIEPHLRQGAIVLSDRYLMSSYAYQASRLPLTWVSHANARARPADVTLFFRVCTATAARRRQARGGAAEHFESDERLTHVAQLYEQALGLPELGKTYTFDAELSVDDLTASLCNRLDAHLARSS